MKSYCMVNGLKKKKATLHQLIDVYLTVNLKF